MIKKNPTVVNNPNQQKAAGMKLAGVGKFISNLPLIGKPAKAFGTGARKGIDTMLELENKKGRKYYVSGIIPKGDPDY